MPKGRIPLGQREARWVPLQDWMSQDQGSFYGVESPAVDPKSARTIWLLAGFNYDSSYKTAILRATDYGATFSITGVTSQFRAHGNAKCRQNGERLVVDANTPPWLTRTAPTSVFATSSDRLHAAKRFPNGEIAGARDVKCERVKRSSSLMGIVLHPHQTEIKRLKDSSVS